MQDQKECQRGLEYLVRLWSSPVRQWGLRRKFSVRTQEDDILLVSWIAGRSDVCSTIFAKFADALSLSDQSRVHTIMKKGNIPVVYIEGSQYVLCETISGAIGDPPSGLSLLKPHQGTIDLSYENIISDPGHF